MSTRRDFIKNTALSSGLLLSQGLFAATLKKALAIDPVPNSSYLDAEHVVILMQENRSFDHCYGSLRGVRGFNDPRVMTQPNGNISWLQTNKKGETYTPFRFNIKESKATWMGAVPHSRHSQVDADNRGKYDRWLEAKRVGNKKYKEMPLTMGYYNREDLPFHYSLADAFTICDQNFCAAMTSTWPNRFFLWSGTVRSEKGGEGRAIIRNKRPYELKEQWKTFPERLQEEGIKWKVYQNSLSTGGGLKGEERSWMANYSCNPLEFFPQYHVRFFKRYYNSLIQRVKDLSEEIKELEEELAGTKDDDKRKAKLKDSLKKKKEVLTTSREEIEEWKPEKFEELKEFEKELYKNAFCINDADPDYMQLEELKIDENKKVRIPKGDVLYQFRKDVQSGNLPAVSWMVPSQNFSDHPSAPWYGAWFTSEIIDILIENPEVWKKTIFILTYDENDGYFDHIPPYVAPHHKEPGTGKCSSGIKLDGSEFILREDEIKFGINKSIARTAPIGLGFRVPMVIASPWSRGGKVCSEIFDHTSVLKFLENFLNQKYDKNIREENISEWRRAVTGDLTSAFAEFKEKDKSAINFVDREEHIATIYKAKDKGKPKGFFPLSKEEIQKANSEYLTTNLLPKQESGVRKSQPLPYELYVTGELDTSKKHFEIHMEAGKSVFGKKSAGSPFKVYAVNEYKIAKPTYKDAPEDDYQKSRSWDFAVKPGEDVSEKWDLNRFKNEKYHLEVFGPNGFYRMFKGTDQAPLLRIKTDYERKKTRGKEILTGNVSVQINNKDTKKIVVIVEDKYSGEEFKVKIDGAGEKKIVLNSERFGNWYDFSVRFPEDADFECQFAGRLETGKETISDPLMGGAVEEYLKGIRS